jgi:ADP-ribosylation factor related protein 1
MYSLITGCAREIFRKREYGVLLIGLEGAGKTTLLERLKNTWGGVPGLTPDKIVSTVGCNVARLTLESCKSIVWDLGGRASLRSIWPKYYADAHSLIWAVDSNDTVHWEESANVLREVLKENPSIPVLVFCCKADLVGSKSKGEVQDFFALTESRVRFFSAAALSEDDIRIREGMAWLEKKLEESGPDK